MDLSFAFFYLFSAVMVASAFMVVAARNPVHAVLFLILAFVNAAGLFLLLSAEFLAMILVVVYVGAVAVLFLFVVMMLDVDFAELKQGFLQYLPVGALIGVIFLIELIFIGATVVAGGKIAGAPLAVNAVAVNAQNVSNVKAIGQALYTTYVFYFEAAGLILLVAMVGAIVLTLQRREGVKRQNTLEQNSRTKLTAIEVRKVPFRQGV
ncbi:NADH dehydrogenase subunit J [Rhizobiales bacterium GAS113]|jgi:NADH-quinone oxidoreductase subunit J|nr:NADH dehydrogenase subunit J [Rhizobiales bacterium GAS113]SEC00777.1 NADH dehydrogenase subunit J [Rhizobiales bacterium GAS188]